MFGRNPRHFLVLVAILLCVYMGMQMASYFSPGERREGFLAPGGALDVDDQSHGRAVLPIPSESKGEGPRVPVDPVEGIESTPIQTGPSAGVLGKPATHTLNIVHANTGQSLPQGEVWRGAQVPKARIGSWILEGPDPVETIKLKPPIFAELLTKSDSPMSVPLRPEPHNYWVSAPGFEWKMVSDLALDAESTVTLKPTGSIQFQISGIGSDQDEATHYLDVIFREPDAQRVRLKDVIIVEPQVTLDRIPTGPIHLVVRADNRLNAGFILFDGEWTVVEGEVHVVPLDLSKLQGTATLGLTILSQKQNTPKASLYLADEKELLIGGRSLKEFRGGPDTRSGYACQSINEFQGFQPGTYHLRLDPYSVFRTIELFPGGRSDLTVDLSSLRWLQVKLAGPEELANQYGLTLALKPNEPVASRHLAHEELFHVWKGMIPQLIAPPGTYSIRSTRPDWVVKTPTFEIPKSGSEVLELPMKRENIYATRLMLEMATGQIGQVYPIAASLRAEALGHDGELLSSRATIVHLQSESTDRKLQHICTVRFSKPGRYRLSSVENEIVPIVVDVSEEPSDVPVKVYPPR